MMQLKEKGALPLLLCSNMMVKSFPAFHCDRESMDVSDVMTKMKVLEESFNGFMKQNNEQLQVLTDTVSNIKLPASFSTMDVGTPNSKKRKVENGEIVPTQVAGISSIPGLNYAGAAKGNVRSNLSVIQRQPQTPISQHGHPSYPPLGPAAAVLQSNLNNSNSNQQQTRRRPSTLVYGNARHGKNESEQFICSADVNLVASGVSKDATMEQFKDFITSKGINVTDIELLTNFKEEARSYTYRIAIRPEDYEKALKPEVWPYRVGVRPFRQRRRPQQESWQHQSRQTGGNIVMNHETNLKARFQPPVPHLSVTGQHSDTLNTSNRYVVDGFESEVYN